MATDIHTYNDTNKHIHSTARTCRQCLVSSLYRCVSTSVILPLSPSPPLPPSHLTVVQSLQAAEESASQSFLLRLNSRMPLPLTFLQRSLSPKERRRQPRSSRASCATTKLLPRLTLRGIHRGRSATRCPTALNQGSNAPASPPTLRLPLKRDMGSGHSCDERALLSRAKYTFCESHPVHK